MKSCCFTGHRFVPEEEKTALRIELDVTVRRLIKEGVEEFYCGGARGFDTLAAETVLHLKKTYPFIQLNFILPCTDQTRFWGKADQQKYSYLLAHSDDVHCLYEGYRPHCMHERNRELVNASQTCVCYLKEQDGGTAYTVAYAAKNHKRIIPLGLNREQRERFENVYLSGQLDFMEFESAFD